MLVRVLKDFLLRPEANRRKRSELSALLQDAVRLWSEGDLAAAEAACRRILAVQGANVDALQLLGAVLHAARNTTQAVAVLRRACALSPDNADIHFHLANALATNGELTDAIAEFRESARLRPEFAPTLIGLGNTHRTLGQLDHAVDSYRKALQSDAAIGQGWHSLGTVYYERGENANAIAAFNEALRLLGESSETQFSRSLALLASGDLVRGWEEYEARKRVSRHGSDTRFSTFPAWNGGSLAGCALLITSEQGVGDEILFASMYREVIARPRLCMISCASKLETLFRRSFAGAQVFSANDLPDPQALQVDFQIDAGSLARFLRPHLSTFSDHSGFLVADTQRVQHWRGRFSQLGPGLKVGICWRSANRSALREFANTSLLDWGEIFSVPGIHFVSLQYDQCDAELDQARKRFRVSIDRFPEVDYFDDLDEVAAQMCALDLVISSRTTVSWEAAALGVPTWQLSGGGDWRGHGTTGVPWMPRLTRFQRSWNQPWSEVLSAVAKRLSEFKLGILPVRVEAQRPRHLG